MGQRSRLLQSPHPGSGLQGQGVGSTAVGRTPVGIQSFKELNGGGSTALGPEPIGVDRGCNPGWNGAGGARSTAAFRLDRKPALQALAEEGEAQHQHEHR